MMSLLSQNLSPLYQKKLWAARFFPVQTAQTADDFIFANSSFSTPSYGSSLAILFLTSLQPLTGCEDRDGRQLRTSALHPILGIGPSIPRSHAKSHFRRRRLFKEASRLVRGWSAPLVHSSWEINPTDQKIRFG